MTPLIRRIRPTDIDACARVTYESFSSVAQRHRFPPDFESLAHAARLIQHLVLEIGATGVVAEGPTGILGCNFLDKREPVRSVGPLCVDVAWRRHGVGRSLMESILNEDSSAAGFRLVQDSFNLASLSLFLSLGFNALESLCFVQRTPTRPGSLPPSAERYTGQRRTAVSSLFERVRGDGHAPDDEGGLCVVESDRVTAYISGAGAWPYRYAIAESPDRMQVAITAAECIFREPLGFLVPLSHSDFLRWAVQNGFQLIKPMTMMGIGRYIFPEGIYFPFY